MIAIHAGKSPTPIIEIYLSKFQTDVGKSWFATRKKQTNKQKQNIQINLNKQTKQTKTNWIKKKRNQDQFQNPTGKL
jgi:hypothetical protein